MHALNEQDIRSSFINASLRERNGLTLPPELASQPWDSLDYLGWRDSKFPALGYVIAELDGAPVGILLRQVDGKLRSRPQCAWCEDVYLPNDVVFFNARRTGKAGRNGNTVGTLICANFECSANVRKLPPVAYIGFDAEAARQGRIAALRENVPNFVRNIRDGD